MFLLSNGRRTPYWSTLYFMDSTWWWKYVGSIHDSWFCNFYSPCILINPLDQTVHTPVLSKEWYGEAGHSRRGQATPRRFAGDPWEVAESYWCLQGGNQFLNSSDKEYITWITLDQSDLPMAWSSWNKSCHRWPSRFLYGFYFQHMVVKQMMYITLDRSVRFLWVSLQVVSLDQSICSNVGISN